MFGFLSSPPFKKVFCFPLLHGACSALQEQAKRAGFCSRTPADPFQRGLAEGLGAAGAGAAQASGGRQCSGGLRSGPRDGTGGCLCLRSKVTVGPFCWACLRAPLSHRPSLRDALFPSLQNLWSAVGTVSGWFLLSGTHQLLPYITSKS